MGGIFSRSHSEVALHSEVQLDGGRNRPVLRQRASCTVRFQLKSDVLCAWSFFQMHKDPEDDESWKTPVCFVVRFRITSTIRFLKWIGLLKVRNDRISTESLIPDRSPPESSLSGSNSSYTLVRDSRVRQGCLRSLAILRVRRVLRRASDSLL